MRIYVESEKTFPELKIKEIKRIDWTSVTPEDYALATERELVHFPTEALLTYFNETEKKFDSLSEAAWVKIINKSKKSNEHKLDIPNILKAVDCPKQFILDNIELLEKNKISSGSLYFHGLIPLRDVTCVLGYGAMVYNNDSEEDLLHYLLNTNYMHYHTTEDPDNSYYPLFLSVANLQKLGLPDLFTGLDLTLYLTRGEHKFFTNRLNGKELTWDNIIDIMYSGNTEQYNKCWDGLIQVWMNNDPMIGFDASHLYHPEMSNGEDLL